MNPGESAVDLAAKRLERAVHVLEQRLADRLRPAGPAVGPEGGDLFDQGRAELAAELDRSRARERELEEAGAQASVALGKAIEEIKAALNGPAPMDNGAEQ